MAVTGFSSSSWAVRNASMQLFGKRDNCRVAKGQKMGRAKIHQGRGKCLELYYESQKIDILKKSEGK